jgi:hypothetical protein
MSPAISTPVGTSASERSSYPRPVGTPSLDGGIMVPDTGDAPRAVRRSVECVLARSSGRARQ